MKRNSFSFIVITLIMSVCHMVPLLFASQEILILGNDYRRPKIYKEAGKPKGILVDILKYLEKELKCNFDIGLYPWARAYRSAVEGRGGIIGLSKTRERLTIFDYSDVVYYDDVVIVVIKGEVFQFEKIADLKGKKIGVGRGGSYGDAFEKGKDIGLFEVYEDDGPIQRLNLLLRNRIDAALIGAGKIGLLEILSQDDELLKEKDKFVCLPKPFKRDPNYLGFAKQLNMNAFLKKFNTALANGYNSGEIDKILHQEQHG